MIDSRKLKVCVNNGRYTVSKIAWRRGTVEGDDVVDWVDRLVPHLLEGVFEVAQNWHDDLLDAFFRWLWFDVLDL